MGDLFIRRAFILLCVIGLGWVVWLLQPILAPFVAAFLLAYLLSPLVDRLVQYAVIPRWVAIVLVFLVMSSALVAAVAILAPMMWDQLVFAKAHIPDMIRWINANLRPWLKENFNIRTDRLDLDQLITWLVGYLQNNYDGKQTQLALTNLARSGLNVINIVGLVVLVPIVTFYFLLDWQQMLTRIRELIPRRYEAKTVQICQECHQVLGAFVKGQFLVMLLLGAVYAIGLQLVGIKIGLIIGLVAGLASIIPYLGFAVGLIAAIMASLFQFGMDWTQLALVGAVFAIGQIVEGYILQPFLLGDKIGLSPVAVIFAVMAGAQLAGFVGMLLALPIAAVLVVLLRHVHQSYAQSQLYQQSSPSTLIQNKEGQS